MCATFDYFSPPLTSCLPFILILFTPFFTQIFFLLGSRTPFFSPSSWRSMHGFHVNFCLFYASTNSRRTRAGGQIAYKTKMHDPCQGTHSSQPATRCSNVILRCGIRNRIHLVLAHPLRYGNRREMENGKWMGYAVSVSCSVLACDNSSQLVSHALAGTRNTLQCWNYYCTCCVLYEGVPG